MSVNIDETRRKVEDLKVGITDLDSETRRFTQSMFSLSRQMLRMGLPEDARAAINYMYTTIRVVNSLRAAYLALQAARMAAGDPLAWIQFGAAALSTGINIQTEIERRSVEW